MQLKFRFNSKRFIFLRSVTETALLRCSTGLLIPSIRTESESWELFRHRRVTQHPKPPFFNFEQPSECTPTSAMSNLLRDSNLVIPTLIVLLFESRLKESTKLWNTNPSLASS